MRQVAAILTFASFFLWIQPLGAFIRPSDEEGTCGGRRAFHMCSAQFASDASAASQKSHLTASSSVSVEKTGSSASSSAFLDLALTPSAQNVAGGRLSEVALTFPAQIFFAPPAPVPKR